jgi:hypothetical protein
VGVNNNFIELTISLFWCLLNQHFTVARIKLYQTIQLQYRSSIVTTTGSATKTTLPETMASSLMAGHCSVCAANNYINFLQIKMKY